MIRAVSSIGSVYRVSGPSGFAAMPIGMPFPVLDNLTGADVPSNSGTEKFIKLTASDSFNTGLLDNETVTGTAPLVDATADIDLSDSPLNGETVHLINSEEAVLRGRETAGVLQFDQMQKITGELESRGGPHTQVSAGALGSNSGNRVTGSSTSTTEGTIALDSANSPNARVSSTTSGETRAKNVSVTYYMRIR